MVAGGGRGLLLALSIASVGACVTGGTEPEAPASAEERHIQHCVDLLRKMNVWCRSDRVDPSRGGLGRLSSGFDCLDARIRLKQRCY